MFTTSLKSPFSVIKTFYRHGRLQVHTLRMNIKSLLASKPAVMLQGPLVLAHQIKSDRSWAQMKEKTGVRLCINLNSELQTNVE